jgi:signal transduction histidine kinase
MPSIIDASLTMFDDRMKAKKLQLTKTIPEKLPPLFGNPIQLRQMIDNLLDNAIKYNPEAGKVKVEVQVDGNQLIFQIADSGTGIPPLDLPYIFDKFYRASNTSPEVPGTGLGLSIVKSIVENHQGRIWVDSTQEKGTNVTVVLPVAEAAGT